MQQVDDHFCVGAGRHRVTGFDQLASQRGVVFYDAVMHQGNTLPGGMWMGIFPRGFAVRRPPGVCNAGAAEEGLLQLRRLQFFHLAIALVYLQVRCWSSISAIPAES
jgi:hypothetical protein